MECKNNFLNQFFKIESKNNSLFIFSNENFFLLLKISDRLSVHSFSFYNRLELFTTNMFYDLTEWQNVVVKFITSLPSTLLLHNRNIDALGLKIQGSGVLIFFQNYCLGVHEVWTIPFLHFINKFLYRYFVVYPYPPTYSQSRYVQQGNNKKIL